MSVGSADLRKAINTVWDAQSLDVVFTALWDASVTASEWVVLEDQEAQTKHPFPYCVFEQGTGNTRSRMTGIGNVLQEIRDIPFLFRVHARSVSGDPRTASEIVAFLIEEIMKVFGGHPSVSPQALTLDSGKFLIAQYQNDFVVKTGDDEYEGILSYIFRLDMDMAI